MKQWKAICITLVLSLMMLPFFSGVTLAAEGSLQFSDPSTKTGENVEVSVKILTGGEAIGDGKATISYDKDYLEFVSGKNATLDSTGTVKLSATGNGSESELTYSITFKALKEGETKLKATETTAYLYNDETLNLTLGESTIAIEKGSEVVTDKEKDENKGTTGESAEVSIDGKLYKTSGEFSDTELPQGYVRGTVSYAGKNIDAAIKEGSDYSLVYLDDSKEKKFFVFNKNTQVFSPFSFIKISDIAYIIPLPKEPDMKIPGHFEENEMVINGNEFRAWQNLEYPAYYLIYGVNNNGDTGFYQYDTQDETYQRYQMPKTEDDKEKTNENPVLDKAIKFVKQYFKFVAIGAGVLAGLILLLILILAVKLHNRNKELDDLYEEYHLGEEEEKPKKAAKQGKKSKKVKMVDSDLEVLDDEEETDFGGTTEAFDEDYEEDDLYEEDDDYDEEDDDDDISFIDLD